MTLAQLAYFEKLTEIGNMGKTADVLHISQPSLSISISKLESELNVQLFNRIGHKLFLTDAGQHFLVHAKTILRAVHEAELHMQSLSSLRETSIRIGCIAPVLDGYLPKIMHDFLSIPENENIKIDFTTDNTTQLISKLKDEYFDFIFCSQSDDNGLFQNVVISEPIVLLCPPGESIPTTWDEILEKNLIGFHQRAAAHHEMHKLLIRQGIQPNYIYRAPDEESIASLVSSGLGYGFVPKIPTLQHYDCEIAFLPQPNEHFIRNIYLTQLVTRPPIGASKRFLQYLKQVLAQKNTK